MTQKSSFLTKLGQVVAVLLVTALFVALGLWQLQRAADLKESLKVATAVDMNVVPLESITRPREVALLQVGDRSAILVVRGLWSERLLNPDIAQSMDIQIEGLLVASQDGDRARNQPGEISRLDSAVVTSLTDLDLFDGYIVATSETTRNQSLERTRVVPEKLQSRIPGFYWQHLSYVVIWWLMAAVVVFLPFYRRRVST